MCAHVCACICVCVCVYMCVHVCVQTGGGEGGNHVMRTLKLYMHVMSGMGRCGMAWATSAQTNVEEEEGVHALPIF